MIRVCLADNHPVVHHGVKSYFKDSSSVNFVGVVSNLDDLDELLKKKAVDVVVLDLELEGLTSINLVKSLIREYSDSKFVVFTNLGEQIYAPNALKAGVSAYIHKSSKLEDLENAIKKVNERTMVVFSEAVKRKIWLY